MRWFRKRAVRDYPNIDALNLKLLPEDIVWHVSKITQSYDAGDISAREAMNRVAFLIGWAEDKLRDSNERQDLNNEAR